MKLLRLIPDGTRLPFMAWRNYTFGFSVVLILTALVGWLLLGFNFGIDFVGGTVIEARNAKGPADLTEIRHTLEGLRLGDIQLKTFGQPDDILLRIGHQAGGNEAQQVAVDKVRAALGGDFEFRHVETVGPAVSADLRKDATIAILASLALILAYLWFRFEWQFAVGAILTTMHDVVIALGVMAWFQISFDLPILAALLTVVGYSLNDTVVIYDRIRETLRKYKRMPLTDIINLSINQTLSRTVVTAITVLIAALALLVFGGDALRGFNLIMVAGVVVGTYSSIVVAAPILILLHLRNSAITGDADDGKKPKAG